MERPSRPSAALPIVATAVWGVLLVPALFSVLFTPMLFDAPGSTANPQTYFFLALVLSFPLLCAISIASSWIVRGVSRKRGSAPSTPAQIVLACLPLLPVSVIGVLLMIPLFTEPWGLHSTIIKH